MTSGAETGGAGAPPADGAGPEASADATSAARTFIEAVAWGEHRTVWDLLGPEGRKTVLRVGVKNGMDEALAARLRDGTAGMTESEEFLGELVDGLRADLAGNNLDDLEYAADPEHAPGQVRVVLTAPVPPLLGPVGLPVGSVELAEIDGVWRVERLTPRPPGATP
ncbi:MAG TPA: hypothetical protein VHM89_02570 [Acidimicrobiales bacterium]|nr:hypothetical protein [Acidimicrobiales bacterium]